MKAAVVEEIGKPLVVHRDWPDLDCGTDEAVIRVEANGIRRTDHHMWKGGWPWLGITTPVPIVLGHEYCGVVEQVGAPASGPVIGSWSRSITAVAGVRSVRLDIRRCAWICDSPCSSTRAGSSATRRWREPT